MTWFGTVSAWAAAVIGAFFAFLAAVQFSAGVVPWLTLLGAALLLMGAFRTLRKMSGGLRLLCGAWGFAAGLMFYATRSLSIAVVIPENAPEAIVAAALLALPYLPLVFLALTVTHKETK